MTEGRIWPEPPPMTESPAHDESCESQFCDGGFCACSYRASLVALERQVKDLTEELAASRTLKRIHDACRESAEKECDELKREREEDRQAIREAPRNVTIAEWMAWHEKHAAAIARAERP